MRNLFFIDAETGNRKILLMCVWNGMSRKRKNEVLKASKLRKLKKIYGLGRIKVSKQLQQLVLLITC